MKSFNSLPEGYSEIYSVDLKKNKKLSLFVNAAALIIAVGMVIPMHFYVPITTIIDMEKGLGAYCIRFASLLVLMVLYIVLHEVVHGISMKICGTKKIKYGFTGVYAFAGSDDYYDKKSYIFIALAPIVLWGIVLAVVNFFVPVEWFWVVYFLQIVNISGAAGDLFVTVKFSRLPSDILVQDYGVGMKVYSKQ
ncbi:MAG: DUF3267 domain-containing protein [Clostridia bacterium]|nr:DUF3267 domain-containing protein [Clostridia bacterium]